MTKKCHRQKHRVQQESVLFGIGRTGDQYYTYQEKLGELSVVEMLVPLHAKVQPYELTVPVEGDVLMDGGLAEDLLHILCRGDKQETSCRFNND